MKIKYVRMFILVLLILSFCSLDTYALNNDSEIVIEVSDKKDMWKSKTDIDIFKISYQNDEEDIIINSDNNDKVIAPGSRNCYTFKIKNVSDTSVDYTFTAACYMTPHNLSIPIQARIKRYDGQWIMGDEQIYLPVNDMNKVKDQMTLSKNSYVYYTLDWMWPYESCNDEYDTYLGNLAKQDDITLTMTLNISASVNEDKNASGGILVETGDDYDVLVYILLLCASLTGIYFTIKLSQ